MAGWVSFSWMATWTCRTTDANTEWGALLCLFFGTRKSHLLNNKWGTFSFPNAACYLLHLVRQFAEIRARNFPGAKLGDLETANDVLQGGRYYKVLLLQTELLSFKELRVKMHICLFVPHRQRWRDFFKHTIWNISDCSSCSWTANLGPSMKKPTTLITLTARGYEVKIT